MAFSPVMDVQGSVCVYITAPSEAEAKSLACGLLGERLIACANIHGPVTSLYHWEGKVAETQEWLFFGKTVATHQQAVMDYVARHHPYQVPCAIFLPVSAGLPGFLQWIADETTPKKDH